MHDKPPAWAEDADAYIATLALRAREAEDEARRARQELAQASARLQRGRAGVLGGVSEVTPQEDARLGGGGS